MFDRLEDETPMPDWNPAQLQQFIRNARPIADRVNRAEELLKTHAI